MDKRLMIIDSGDDRSPEELKALLAKESLPLRLKISDDDDAPAPQETFRNLGALLDKEEENEKGGEFEMPEVPGFFVSISGSIIVSDVITREMNKYLKAHREVKKRDDIPARASFKIMATSLVDGHSVTGWRGAVFEDGGIEEPFSKEAFVALYAKSAAFREFVFGHYERLSGIARRARAADRGE